MTDPDYTALLLIIDRSGSMTSIRDDMVGGLTTMLVEQASHEGRLTVDVVTFDDTVELQCSMVAPDDVVITLEPRGMTALFDAIGIGVKQFGATLAALPEQERPGVVQVVVVTDGQENSSKEYTPDAVRTIVAEQTTHYGWDFVYLGANQDAVLTSANLGFDADSSLTYDASSRAVDSMKSSLGRYVSSVRSSNKVGFTGAERSEAAGGL